jgi:NTE family protein
MTGTALVLGGGGVTGVAWELGVIAGLADAGVDLTTADVVIGTSAGAVVAAQITSGVPVEQAFARQLEPPTGEISARMPAGALLRFAAATLTTRDPRTYAARIGRMALTTATVAEAERRSVIESRLPVHEWPDRALKVTAVVADTGEFVVLDADSGASLVDAVAASCAVPGVWPPVTIGGRRYVDGGVRSPVNADLAAGHDRIVVIAPMSRGGGAIPRLRDQVRALAEHGQVVVVEPDAAARAAFGRNVLDPSRRAPAAHAGRAQAAKVATEVAKVWTART